MHDAWCFRPYAKYGNWYAYLGEPNMVERGISNSCRWFWQQLFLSRTMAPSVSRKMSTFSRGSLKLGYVKLYPNSTPRVRLKQSWQPQAWFPLSSELSAVGVKTLRKPTNATSTVIRPFDPPLTRPAKCRLWPSDDDDWALCRTSQIPKKFCSCKWGIRSRWPSDRHPVEFGQDNATAYLCYV